MTHTCTENDMTTLRPTMTDHLTSKTGSQVTHNTGHHLLASFGLSESFRSWIRQTRDRQTDRRRGAMRIMVPARGKAAHSISRKRLATDEWTRRPWSVCGHSQGALNTGIQNTIQVCSCYVASCKISWNSYCNFFYPLAPLFPMPLFPSFSSLSLSPLMVY